jgi:hypothetical protein
MIKLPPLPMHPDPHTYRWTELERITMRVMQIASARAALEAAAEVCKEQMDSAYAMYHGDVKPIPESGLTSGYAYFEGQGDGATSCGDGIRALRIEGETT